MARTIGKINMPKPKINAAPPDNKPDSGGTTSEAQTQRETRQKGRRKNVH